MSKILDIRQSANPQGEVIIDEGGIRFARGTTVPADGGAGYAPNCLFFDTDAAGGAGVYLNVGTLAACNFDLFTGGLIQPLVTGAGAGITGGTGTVYKSSVETTGDFITTTILIDLTGLASSTTDLDIIGVSTTPAHIGRITAAQNGTIFGVRMTCLELPAGGADDIDLYSAAEGTGVFDGAVGDLTETALITSGAAWASGTVKASTDVPAANQYLYLTGGEAGTAATYTAGKFMIELFGYAA